MKKFLVAVMVVALAAFAAPALAATNPFMDVPASHWAYDSIAQLASRGVISGYPDGTYKGGQPATRYEMASVLARSLAKIDLDKASKQDVEMMRKLIIEFSDELTALGVKVDQLDERVAVLEKDLGGWSMAGELQFDLKFTGDGDNSAFYADDADIVGKNEFDLNRYRFWINKRIDENTRFSARFGHTGGAGTNRGMRWERYYVTTKLPYDIDFTVGRQAYDLEGDLGLYDDNDSWAADLVLDALSFKKSWGVADLFLLAARQNDNMWGTDGLRSVSNGLYDITSNPRALANTTEAFLFAANINANFSDRFRAGLLGYWLMTDEEVPISATQDTDHDLSMYGVYAGFKFTPDIELKGIYYSQKVGDDRPGAYVRANGSIDDSSSAWKAILDVKQEALKFTSLWLEYGQMDNNFELLGGMNPYAWYGAEIIYDGGVVAFFPSNTRTIMLIRAAQQWNDKWNTLLRYAQVDFDTQGVKDAKNWTFEVGYQYTPAIKFTLGYDNVDYGDYGAGADFSDHMIRFRTFVSF
jgi:hypothetical protein